MTALAGGRLKAGKRTGPLVAPLGDSAVLLTVADAMDLGANALARRVAAEIRARRPDWITDVVPALVTVAVYFEARTAGEAVERRATAERLLLEAAARGAHARDDTPSRTVEIPVCYDPAYAPDLEEVARRTALAAARVVELHVAGLHRVLMIGFAPGHPYIGGLDPRLAVPRRASPRLRVEVGSVAIANAQTAIYPYATPGGWNVIGRTPLSLFVPAREPASLLEPGDAVRFVPIPRGEFERIAR